MYDFDLLLGKRSTPNLEFMTVARFDLVAKKAIGKRKGYDIRCFTSDGGLAKP